MNPLDYADKVVKDHYDYCKAEYETAKLELEKAKRALDRAKIAVNCSHPIEHLEVIGSFITIETRCNKCGFTWYN